MAANHDSGPVDEIIALARAIIDECPSCAGKASRIAMWAGEIRERRPSRAELEALVAATCGTYLPDGQKASLIEGLRALVRFAE
jgi:hypothetical protein